MSDVSSASNLCGTVAATIGPRLPDFTLPTAKPKLDPQVQGIKSPPGPVPDMRPNVPAIQSNEGPPFILRTSENGARTNTLPSQVDAQAGTTPGQSVQGVRIVGSNGDREHPVKHTVNVSPSNVSVTATVGNGETTFTGSVSVNPTVRDGQYVDRTPVTVGVRGSLPVVPGTVAPFGGVATDRLGGGPGTTTAQGGFVVGRLKGVDSSQDLNAPLMIGVRATERVSATGQETNTSVPFVGTNTSIGGLGVAGEVALPKDGPTVNLTLYGNPSKDSSLAGGVSFTSGNASRDPDLLIWAGGVVRF